MITDQDLKDGLDAINKIRVEVLNLDPLDALLPGIYHSHGKLHLSESDKKGWTVFDCIVARNLNHGYDKFVGCGYYDAGIYETKKLSFDKSRSRIVLPEILGKIAQEWDQRRMPKEYYEEPS